MATPLLAPMIESGFFNNTISQKVINEYLSDERLQQIQAMILACTHYPLIKPEIEHYYQKALPVLDSTDTVARYLKHQLKERGQLKEKGEGQRKFYISDYTEAFEKTANIFYEGSVELEHYSLW
jgi:glutamate racemase